MIFPLSFTIKYYYYKEIAPGIFLQNRKHPSFVFYFLTYWKFSRPFIADERWLNYYIGILNVASIPFNLNMQDVEKRNGRVFWEREYGEGREGGKREKRQELEEGDDEEKEEFCLFFFFFLLLFFFLLIIKNPIREQNTPKRKPNQLKAPLNLNSIKSYINENFHNTKYCKSLFHIILPGLSKSFKQVKSLWNSWNSW